MWIQFLWDDTEEIKSIKDMQKIQRKIMDSHQHNSRYSNKLKHQCKHLGKLRKKSGLTIGGHFCFLTLEFFVDGVGLLKWFILGKNVGILD